jgi:hypothetical protein
MTTATKVQREQMQQEALSRAVSGQTMSNWPAIIAGFTAKGIPESDIKPRENVLTYHAWRALGRQVRRGEHGVKVVTFVSVAGKEGAENTEEGDGTDKPRKGGHRRPWTAVVFHESQLVPIKP